MNTEELAEFYRKGLETGASLAGAAFVPEHLHKYRIERAVSILHRFGAKSILDVGCGIGLLKPKIAETPYHGIDIVPELVDKAISNFGPYFSVGTAEQLTGTYDAVVCLGVMAHVSREEAPVFMESLMARSSRLVIVEAQNPNDYKGTFHAHTLSNLLTLLQAGGFQTFWDYDETQDSTYRVIGRKR